MQPGGRTSAPGKLALVQAFANSKDLLSQQDVFTSVEMLRAWLITRDLLEKNADLTKDDFPRMLAFREALRCLIGSNGGLALSGEVIEVLNQAASRAHLHILFAPDGSARLAQSAADLDGAIGQLLSIVYTAMAEGNWERLKACQNEGCRWVYYDNSKNQSGSWCSMAMCGNRLKTSTYRQRKKYQFGEQKDPSPAPRRQNHARKSTFHRQQQNR